MSRRLNVRATFLAPFRRALVLHDQHTRALLCGPDAPGIRGELASIRHAWRETLAELTDADVAALIPMLADRLPADPRGRVSAGGAL